MEMKKLKVGMQGSNEITGNLKEEMQEFEGEKIILEPRERIEELNKGIKTLRGIARFDEDNERAQPGTSTLIEADQFLKGRIEELEQ
jgi:hypothetical protein